MRIRAAVLTVLGMMVLAGAGGAAAKPIVMPTVTKEFQEQRSALADPHYVNPPAPPCPENGVLYPPPVSGLPLGNCGIAQPVATSTPWPGNMAYYGGHVQVHPKEYLVYWGWGEPGAFPGRACASETLTEGQLRARLACDPDGAGKYMADFVHQMGGTSWANVSTQYYQSGASGSSQHVSNDKNVLASIWVDDSNSITGLPKTNSSNPAGSSNTYYDLAMEAYRAAQHFGLSGSALTDANFIILQPPAYSDPNALSTGYCAFHDYTLYGVPGNGYYKGVPEALSYTNMPYALAINSSGINVCGENAVNYNSSNPSVGKLDGFSIVLGHEIEETITDPGAEDIVGNATSASQTYYGGWYDATDPNENGDKCAWVGENQLTLQGPPLPIYGSMGNITGNTGGKFAVQSLWSNADNEGTGYCAGAGTDSPIPAAAYGSTSGSSGNSGGSSGGSGGGTGPNSGGSQSAGTSGSSTSASTTSSSSSTSSHSSAAKKRAVHKKKVTHTKRRTRRKGKRHTAKRTARKTARHR